MNANENSRQQTISENGTDQAQRRCRALTRKFRRCRNAPIRDRFLPLCTQHEHLPRSLGISTVLAILGILLSSIVIPEIWYYFKGQDEVREEISMSLRAQADGVADRARSYVMQAAEPVATGGGAAWWPVDTGLFDAYKKVHFEDHQSGWVLGTRSLISTIDGGESWTRHFYEDDLQLNELEIVGPQAVWVVGQNGTIFRAPDSMTWERQESGTSNHLYGIDFLDDGLSGWIVGDRGLLLSTTNGGDTWTPQNSGTNQNLIAVHAFDANSVWVGGSSISLSTTDGGKTWVTLGNDKTFTDVLFLDETVGFAAEGNSLYRTTDKGLTWQQRVLRGRRIAVRGYSFVDSQNGWITNLYGTIFRTQNGGNSWSNQQTGVRRLNDVYFIDKFTGWAVGDDGTLINTAPLSLPIDGKTPVELLIMLRASIASPYFERDGTLERLEEYVDDHEVFALALRNLQQAKYPTLTNEPTKD